ncbi:alpha/beta hydrolase [Caballeronia sp. LZ062]|uniref:alpha/beta fold hydrolase n=1 Tax=unclassified Caballeronia TaxID=2646786 RepID=UPI0028630685|nr:MULTISPECIES: alpha/beta hydrolase [unclassified Caballeronia]MDR5854270.1 alpha/beta hydrolase [Caballeronia sp. LZ050]MDR5871199.1 alpha/beta hydrolase [Caballeronia sp. LZ062]
MSASIVVEASHPTLTAPRQRFVQCASPAGLHRMAYTEWGDPANPRVLLCVHGLTRSGRDFDKVAQAFASDYRVVCPDVVGRGLSDWLADSRYYGLAQYVADMVTLIARLNVETVDWFGTSMGGLIGMVLGGLKNTPIRKLLLNDVGPHIEPVALERIRSYLGKPARFASLDEGIRHAAALAASFGPLTDEEWASINAPLLRERDGAWTFRYDPGIAAPFSEATDEQNAAGEAFLWHSFASIATPVLVVRGESSDLLSRETVTQMVEKGQAVSSVEVPNAGHAPAFLDSDQIAVARRFFLENQASGA